MERGFLGSGERGSNHRKKNVSVSPNREINDGQEGKTVSGGEDECVKEAGVDGQVASNDGHAAGNKGCDNRMDDSQTNYSSFAQVLTAGRTFQKVNFRSLVNEDRVDNHDTMLPMAAMEKVLSRFDNTLVGYFLGKTITFPNVKSYVTNTWGKFGLQKLMKNGDGVFLFKFATKDGVDRVLERGPWLIRNSPIILNKWSPSLSLNRNEVTKVPVWIKMHKVPLVAYSEDGLSLIATQVGKPIMLDAFTSSMCVDPWGRISFARALVELSSDSELKSHVTMAIPKENGSGYTTEIINVEYEWKPPHCGDCKSFGHSLIDCPKCVKETVRNDINVAAKVFNPVDNPTAQPHKNGSDGFQTVNNKKKGKQVGPNTGRGGSTKCVVGKHFEYRPKKPPPEPKQVNVSMKLASDVASTSGTRITTSNQFDALNMDDTDVDTGRTMEINEDELTKTGYTSHIPLVNDSMETMDVGSTPIVEKIGKLEKLIIDGRATLVDDDGQPIPSTSSTKRVNPFSKVGEIEVSDSEDEVVDNPFDESANIFGGGHEFEDEYDDYDFDDYAKQVRDLPGNLDAFNAMYGTKFQGPGK